MPRRPATFRQADIVRAVKAARAAGLDVAGVSVTADGTIQVVDRTEKIATSATPFDQWKANRDARQTQGA